MTFTEMAMHMFPFWILGALFMWATIKAGYGNLIRVEGKAVLEFVKFMFFMTIFRVALFKLFPSIVNLLPGDPKALVGFIPWGGTLFVFWEDMVHVVPLVILFNALNDSKAANVIRAVLTGLVMFAFGSGHIYQGLIPAAMISFYIPYTLEFGKKYGSGTVMVCHTIFDLVTLLTLKFLLG